MVAVGGLGGGSMVVVGGLCGGPMDGGQWGGVAVGGFGLCLGLPVFLADRGAAGAAFQFVVKNYS